MLHDLWTSMIVSLCLWAIVSPRVPTGLLGTLGLGIIAVAALWSMDDNHDPFYALDAVLIGVGAVIGGIAWRIARGGRAVMHRATHWRETQPAELNSEDHWRVGGGKQ